MGKKTQNVSFFALKIAEKLSNSKNFRLLRLSAPQGPNFEFGNNSNNGQKCSHGAGRGYANDTMIYLTIVNFRLCMLLP